MELIDLSFELEDILKRKIDLVSTKGIKLKYFDAIKQDILYA
jgi:predicted nucleotidyltransferase